MERLEKLSSDYWWKVLDAIVWLGVDGYGSRWKSAVLLVGLLINQTMMIEPIDEQKD